MLIEWGCIPSEYVLVESPKGCNSLRLTLGELELRKTAHYRRAAHAVGESMFLQSALNSCQDNYQSVGFPVFELKPDVDCVVASHKVKSGRDFLHLVTFERGAGAAVIQTLQSAEVDEAPAPQSKEFIQSQLFLLCSGDNLLWTTHNNSLRDRAVGVMVNRLIEVFGDFEDNPMYVLEANLDEKMFKNLMTQGIQEIDLAVGGYKDTLDYLTNDGSIENAGIISVLKNALSPDLSQEEKEAATKIAARVVLRPGRDWNDMHVKELLADMASNVLDEMDDGFVIVTKNGLRVTHDSMRVKDDFNVNGNRRVVDVKQVHDELQASFGSLESMGVFEN